MSRMRLLTKNEVVQAKSLDRKLEIDEGIKLAKRVDSLRETAAQEEHSLQSFRNKAIALAVAEISALESKKGALEKEVEQLEERKKTALVPLDAEWEKMRSERNVLVLERSNVSNQEASLAQATQKLGERERAITIEEGRIADLKHTAVLKSVQAENVLKQAHESAAETRNKAQVILMVIESRDLESLHREAEVAVREREVGMRTEANLRLEQDLARREILLRDRTAMLERNIKRQQ